MNESTESTADRPLVTFALFAYNQEKYIREAIEGAFAQAYEPLEIILSDDCSSDRTFEIMQEMAAGYRGAHKVVVVQSVGNLGLAGHINRVQRISNGRIITWAAGDDIALPERTAIFVNALMSDPKCVGVHSAVNEIDQSGRFVKYRDCSAKQYMTLDDVISAGGSVGTQSHAFLREVWDRFGDFNMELTQEAIAMAFRELSMGDVAFISRPLTSYRVGSGTSTYAGGDFIRSKYSEPIKYTNWYLTAFKQMSCDLNKVNVELSVENISRIESNMKYYSLLLRINKREAVVWSAFQIFCMHPFDRKLIKALVRIYSPGWLFRLFGRY